MTAKREALGAALEGQCASDSIIKAITTEVFPSQAAIKLTSQSSSITLDAIDIL